MNSHKVMIIQEVDPVDPDLPLHRPDDAPGGLHDLLSELEVVLDHVTEHWTHKPKVWEVGPGSDGYPEAGAIAGLTLPATQAAVVPVQRRD